MGFQWNINILKIFRNNDLNIVNILMETSKDLRSTCLPPRRGSDAVGGFYQL